MEGAPASDNEIKEATEPAPVPALETADETGGDALENAETLEDLALKSIDTNKVKFLEEKSLYDVEKAKGVVDRAIMKGLFNSMELYVEGIINSYEDLDTDENREKTKTILDGQMRILQRILDEDFSSDNEVGVRFTDISNVVDAL